MEKYAGYLLITDMDGTLLNSKKEISLENKAAIKEFVAEGGKFSVATGRSPESAQSWLQQVPINYPCIFYNGSMVKDIQENRVLECVYLDKKCLVLFVEWILEECREVVVEIFTQQGLYVISDAEVKDPYLEEEKDQYIQGTFSQVKNMKWIKILLCSRHEQLQKIEQKLLDDNLNTFCNYFYSQDFFLEITPLNCSKGTALDIIRKKTEGKSMKIIAVGDYDNDEEMLKKADFGVAVENAQDRVKAIADYVSVNHNAHPVVDICKKICEEGL